MPLDISQVDEIRHTVEDMQPMQPKTIKEKLNGSLKPLLIGGGISLTVLIGWIFLAGQRDGELSALKVRVDKIEPVVIALQIEQAGLKSTVMTKLENISNQIEDLQREIRTLKKP